MSRIQDRFAGRDSPVFIPFLVAGDPDPGMSLALAREVVRAGADIIELGMPFSDPVADGPVIQRADTRALEAGMNPDLLFGMVRELRETSDVPIVLLTYYNIVLRRRVERFYRDAHDAGIDGVLVVDLPPEEAGEVLFAARAHGIDPVFIVSGTSSPERVQLITSATRGFLYVVSTLGVTGTRDELDPGVCTLVRELRRQTDLPLAVGFGISRPAHAPPLVDAGADGIIVGSAIVELIERHLGDEEGMKAAIITYVSAMKYAISACPNPAGRPGAGAMKAP